MKALPGPYAAHVAQGTTSLAWLLRITRTDGEVYAFTSAAIDIPLGGVRYLSAPGLDISSIVLSAGLSVDNLELTTLDDGSTFTRGDVLGGRWRNAAFLISRCNYRGVSDGVEDHLGGTIGDVRLHNGYIVAELRGLQQYLQQPIGSVTSKTCRARLGNDACGVDLPSRTFAATVGASSTKQNLILDGFGGDTHYASTVLTLALDGTHGSTTFTDTSPIGATVSVVGGTPTISTAQAKFGGASLYFPSGGAGVIRPPTDAAYAFPGDFTLEFWARPSDNSVGWCVHLGGSINTVKSGGVLVYSGAYRLYWDSNLQSTGAGATLDVWAHIVLTRSAGVFRLFVNGALAGSYTNASNVDDGVVRIGTNAIGSEGFDGYIDDLRITKGVARYTSSFAAPIAANTMHGPIHPEDYFGEGIATFTSGANSGLSQKVKTYSDNGEARLSLPMLLAVAPGDTLDISAGCRKRRTEDCAGKFDNVPRFQGEPDVPGLDELTRPPA